MKQYYLVYRAIDKTVLLTDNKNGYIIIIDTIEAKNYNDAKRQLSSWLK